MRKVPGTATIITRNVAEHIAACIRSVGFFAEVLVIDSGSTDDTVARARAAGARVVENAWPGFGLQKQFAVDQATFDWIFSIDADERVSPALQANIEALFDAGQLSTAEGYQVNRCNHFMGRALRHGEGYPDWCVRLFNRQHCRWTADVVHEKVFCQGPLGLIEGDLDHFSATSLADYLDKQNRYTSLQAAEMFALGKRVSIIKLTLSPALRFIKFYVFRGGCLDGLPGLVHIMIGCFNSFSKYAKLRELVAQQHVARPSDDA